MSSDMSSEKVRVAHLISGLQIGGAEMALHRLVSSMDPQRFENVVISMTDVGDDGAVRFSGEAETISLGMRRGVADPRALARLVVALRTIRPAVLQSWMYHADLAAFFAARMAGVPSAVWNIRCAYVDLAAASVMLRITIRVLAAVSAWPDTVITNSVAGKNFHSQLGYKPRRWEVIPNGFDLEKFQPDRVQRRNVRERLGIPSDAIVIGLIARYDPLKDHANFIKAASLLHDKFPDVRFVMAGRGIDAGNAAVMRDIRDMGLSGAVLLLGEISDLAATNTAFDIASLSSIGEGSPNVIGEAMACAVPCVATDVGDSAAIIGDTGIVVPPRDPLALADGWAQMIQLGPEERRRMGARARERISREFSLSVSTRRYEDLYQGLATRGGGVQRSTNLHG